MAEQMCRDVRRTAERDTGHERGPAAPRHVVRERVRADRIQEHRHDHIEIFRFNHRHPAQQRRRQVTLQCGMRVIDQIDAEGTKQVCRVEEVELG
jgi:hypothetical protein